MLVLGLRSTSDDWPSNLTDESQPKCKKRPPKSLKNDVIGEIKSFLLYILMFRILFTIWREIIHHCVHKLRHKCISQIIYKGCDADSSSEGS